MLIEQQIKQFTSLNKWFQNSLGLSVAEEFKKQLEPVLDYLKGDTLLQLGHYTHNLWLDDLQFNKKWLASPFYAKEDNLLVCSLNHIPLQRNSLDCVVAPLAIEPFDDSVNLIDEIDRILKPMGYVVFFSLNPWSLWGGAIKSGVVNCYSEKQIKMQTAFHLNRLFIQRGYRQCSLNNFYYIPPVNNSTLIKKLSFCNEIGKMLWPFPSGFYCYIAQKYEAISPSLVTDAVMEALPKEYDASLPVTNILGYKPE
ncbi:methyltransferase domain-containing protein [Legionella sp. km772]|uniref:methyltransferase domain-containing protein n=1 Tax=Legionella sp. km772 TaxID=2498111 RepID=UPI000F8D5AFC|nr:methyltransferase domain-containing protein [Legionella sp. km772]RUR12206.1 methyltransferase domain-containing protein [Legionella sp. km772]